VINEEFKGFNPSAVRPGDELSGDQIEMRNKGFEYNKKALAGLRQVKDAIVKSQENGCDISLMLANDLHHIYATIGNIQGRPVEESGMLKGFEHNEGEVHELDTFIALLKNI
jgi:hypothetical protein